MAASAATRRSHHAHRVAVVAKSREQAAERLDSYLKNQPTQGVHSGVVTPGNPTKLAFVFSGQGTQWWAMGREMLAQDAVFRNTLERVDGLLKKHVSWSLLQELQRSEADSKLGATEYAQPALFAVQTALVAVLQGWGIVPSAVVGHSIGEVAAAHAAGVLSLEDAVMLAAVRGKLMQEATGKGKMLSAELSTQQANTLLMEHEGTVALAVINGPKSVVFAGDAAAMDSFAALLADKKVETRWLPVNYAFHSPHMESIAPRLAQALSGLKPSPPKLSIVSSLTGRTAESSAFDAAYWQRQMREAVRFSGAMETLIGDGFTTFLEVGPHPALGHNIHEILSARSVEGSVAFTLRRSLPERDTLLNAAATLHSQGVSVGG